MYQVKYYDYIIFDDKAQEVFPCTSAKLDLEVNTAGSMQITLPISHPNYEVMDRLKMGFRAYKNGKLIFKGQMLEKPIDFNKNAQLVIEGKLATFNDTIVRPSEFGGHPHDYFKRLIDNHNSQSDEEKRFVVGNITVQDPNNYIYRKSEEYNTTMEVLKKLVSSVGGYLSIRYTEETDYIDWLSDFDVNNVQEIHFGENLLDLKQNIDAKSTYSACLPIGKQNDETKEYTTVASVNGGSDIVINESRVAEIGLRVAPPSMTKWDDVANPEHLLKKAKEWLSAKGVMLEDTISLSAIDLAYTDSNINSFDFCKYIKVVSEPHNINKNYLLSKISIDLINPENTRIELGEKQKTMYDVRQKEREYIEGIKTQVDHVGTKVDQAINETRNISSEIGSSAAEIVMKILEDYSKASDIEHLRQEFENKLSITAEGFSFDFNKLTESIKEANALISEQQKWIRFIDGVINIGDSNSEIRSEQDNQSYSFLNRSNDIILRMDTWGVYGSSVKVEKQFKVTDKWAIRPGKDNNLNDVWIGGRV